MQNPKIKPSYHIDFIRINSKKTIHKLESILNLQMLRNNCNDFWLKDPYSRAKLYGYKCRIEAILPKPDFFNLLVEYDPVLELPLYDITKQFSVSKIEFAKDSFFDSMFDATMEAERLGALIKKSTPQKL